MKITLEKTDLVNILAKVFGYALSDEDVTVQADPLEVHVRNVNVDKLARTEEEPSGDFPINDDTEPEEVEEEYPMPEEKSTLTLEELLNANALLANKKTTQPSSTERPLGPDESPDPPPITSIELDALKRIASRPKGR